jgi:hypothetical protein
MLAESVTMIFCKRSATFNTRSLRLSLESLSRRVFGAPVVVEAGCVNTPACIFGNSPKAAAAMKELNEQIADDCASVIDDSRHVSAS